MRRAEPYPWEEAGGVYDQYLYSYPHKLAYRALDPVRTLSEVWADEDASALFVYVHIPFCEQRCGFCNLFTLATPDETLEKSYLSALGRQAARVRGALRGNVRVSRFALGGGTPTYLETSELADVFEMLSRTFGIDPHQVPGSVEVSPETATKEKLDLLANAGVARVSMGIQSFVPGEAEAIRRRQDDRVVHAAIDAIKSRRFPTLNLDLMYGLPGQTTVTFLASIRAALAYAPEELYLYPLYVRELTILGKRPKSAPDTWDEERLALYREGRALLLSEGYEQCSMRMFRRIGTGAPQGSLPYRCQSDAMIGIGCGARSYTRALHHSSAFAVGARGVREILKRYISMSEPDHDRVDWGYVLDTGEQRRRFVILSLLSDEGLDLRLYEQVFGTDALRDVPELEAILTARTDDALAERSASIVRLTPAGIERSDQLGPFLVSARVRALVKEAERQ